MCVINVVINVCQFFVSFWVFLLFLKFSNNKLFYICLIEHYLRGSFYLPSISCVIPYMFCHHQKGGDCWPKGYTLRFMRFDDNKTYKSYLVLIEVLV